MVGYMVGMLGSGLTVPKLVWGGGELTSSVIKRGFWTSFLKSVSLMVPPASSVLI